MDTLLAVHVDATHRQLAFVGQLFHFRQLVAQDLLHRLLRIQTSVSLRDGLQHIRNELLWLS